MRFAFLPLAAVAALAWAQADRLTLQEAVESARKSSPALAEARATHAASLAEAQKAAAMLGLQAGLNAYATRSRSGALLTPPPGTDPGASMAVPPEDFWAGNLMVMIPLHSPELRAMASAAGWRAKASAGRLAEEETSVENMVTEAYAMALGAQAEADAADATLRAAEEMLKTTEARFAAGSTIQASVDRVRAQVRRAERDLTRARASRSKAILDLKETMGVALEGDFALTSLSAPGVDPQLESLLAQSKQRRGLVKEAKAGLEAAKEEARASGGQSRPRLYATGMADATSRQDMGGLTIGLSASVPLYDSGKIRADLARTSAMVRAEEARLKGAELRVEREVRQAWLDMATARATLESAEAGLAAAAASYEVIRMRVEAGKSIVVEQLDALETLAMSRSDLVRARIDLVLAHARMAKATGGSQ